MKIKRFSLLVLVALLSLSMMACPSVVNSGPEFVKLVDEELMTVQTITYEHLRGTDFDPEAMITSIVNEQNIIAIDYIQSGVIWGQDRKYDNISDRIEARSFFAIWVDGDDANFDGVVDSADEELYGKTKTDEDGNVVYDGDKIFLIEVLQVDLDFTLYVTDDDGAETQISGTILIVDTLSE